MNVNIEDIKRPCNMLDEAGYWRARAVIGSNKLLIRLKAEHDCNMRLPEGGLKKPKLKPATLTDTPLPVYPVIPVSVEPYEPSNRPTVRQIQDAVAKHYGITRPQLIGKSRTLEFMIPRHVAVYIARQVTGLSTLQLGRFFGNKDHTCILSSEKRMRSLMQKDADLAHTIAFLIEKITGVQQ